MCLRAGEESREGETPKRHREKHCRRVKACTEKLALDVGQLAPKIREYKVIDRNVSSSQEAHANPQA